ncbi:type IV pilus assembly protein PilM [Patescibacteria group bacterium]
MKLDFISMDLPFLKIIHKKSLGIDIGTTSLKIVELSKYGKRIKLENYGEVSATTLYKKPFRTFEKSTLLLSSKDIARAILAILEKAEIKTKETCFSIPDFSSFFTWFNLPVMSKEELPQAVEYEARQHIPMPLGEVTLDWQVIEDKIFDRKKDKLKILLVAVPNEVVNQYREIATISHLELQALEAEVFSLLRASAKNEKKVTALIDFGAQSTTVNIIDQGVLKISHSFDMSGNDLTENISRSMSVDFEEAEKLKKKQGLLPEKNLREVLLPLIDSVLVEVKKISENFYQTDGKNVEKVILAGGSALLPGLKEYFTEQLNKEVVIADPFSDIFCPPILEKTLKKIGPSFTVAVGAALRNLE